MDELDARLRSLSIIWVAFLGAVGVYTVVAYFLARSGEAPDPEMVPTLRLIFGLVAFSVATASFVLRRVFIQSLLSERPTVGTGVEQSYAARLQRLATGCTIVWALSESVALFGLVLSFLSRDFGQYLPFGAAAAALLFVHRAAAWPIDQLRADGGRPS